MRHYTFGSRMPEELRTNREAIEGLGMSLSEYWACPEDFATLFKYFWHQDFPIDRLHVGATRWDWTHHIGVVVLKIASIVGLYPRFEVERMDAVLRSSNKNDEIAIEWEWDGEWGDELDKLRCHIPYGISEDGKLVDKLP